MGKKMWGFVVVVAVLALTVSPVMAKDLSYPKDCKSATLLKAAGKGGCSAESGKKKHIPVFKNGKLVTSIPHSVKDNQTCKSIIDALNKECL